MILTWDAATHNLCVYVDGSQRLCANSDFVNTVFGGNPNVSWGFTGSTGLYSNQQYFCPIFIPLPVILQRIDVSCADDSTILTWQTASEVNNAYFLVEKSMDSLSFQPLAFISGAGNSNTMQNYRYVDKNHEQKGMYYRLVQVDFDGKATNLGIRFIDCSNRSYGLSIEDVYQNNPLEISVNMLTGSIGKHHFQVLDANSRLISEKYQNLENLENTVNISLPEAVSGGIYIIKISNSETQVSEKVLLK